MNPPDLAGVLATAIGNEPDHWDRSKLHVSDVRHALVDQGCCRQLWLRLHGARARELHLGELLLADHGKRIHGRVASLLEAGLKGSGWRIHVAEHSVVPELRASGLGIERGRLDVELIHDRGDVLIVDIKTVRGAAFRHLKKPKRPHQLQLQTYMMLRGAEAGALLYCDREGQNAVKQFHVQRDDATVERAARVLRVIQSRPEPPDPLPAGPRGGKPWQCGYCSFLGAACQGPGQPMKQSSSNGRRKLKVVR